MNRILYKIKCDNLSPEILPVKVSIFFGLIKFIRKVKVSYEYWVEYRIDENRYWYGEIKPVLDENGFYKILIHQHHSKQEHVGAITIIKDIATRAKMNGYNVKVLVDNSDYNTDKIETGKKVIRGMILR
jgi:hypothetical protein